MGTICRGDNIALQQRFALDVIITSCIMCMYMYIHVHVHCAFIAGIVKTDNHLL